MAPTMPTRMVATSPIEPSPGSRARPRNPAMMPMKIAAMISPIMRTGVPGVSLRQPVGSFRVGGGTSHFPGVRVEPRRPRDPHLLDLGRRGEPGPVPGDPLHARGVRGRGAAGRRRGRLDDPHPRPHARRHAVLRDRGLPRDHRSDPRRGRRRGDQLLHGRGRRAPGEADGLPARAPARRGRAQHGLDELCEVLPPAQGVRVLAGVRELVRHDPRAARVHERVRDPPRARVLRLRPPRQPGPAAGHGRTASAAAGLVRDGGHGRDPSIGPQPRPYGRAGARRAARVGRDRRLARPVDARGGRALARRQRPRRAGGQLLPPRRGDGPLQRRPDHAREADGRGQRPPRGHGGRDAAAARPALADRRMRGPLDGVRVLDLSRLLPGGFCSLLLADFGADVVKVEDTGMGDYVRWAPPFYEGADPSAASALFLSLNRGKRSIRLDLKSERGREVLLRLARGADVLLESFRPGVLDRLGVGYEALREANPGLVYCAITGYGQDGPLRDRAGHDMNYLGRIGLLGLSGDADGPPVQAAGQVADLGGGALMAAFGILAALRGRDRTGEGQLVDASMADGALSWLAMVAARYFAEGRAPRRGGLELAGSLLCYRPYRCSDGWVTLGALEPKFWQAWCRGVGREDLVERQFEPPGSDAHAEVEAVFASRTRDEWEAFGAEHDCCLEPVLGLEEALDSELVRARGMVGDPARAPGPALGQDTDAVLAEAGFGAEEIEALKAAGAVAGADAKSGGSFLA